jgi:beta-phosphoglucomutase-like phosphatase (HAD superfamily)
MLAAFIFDMDGLLVETEGTHILAFREFLAARGLDAPDGFVDSLVGFSVADNVERMKRELGLTGDTAALVAERNAMYIDLVKRTPLSALPGVDQLLIHAHDHRLKTGVCSSSQRTQLDVVLPLLLHGLKRPQRPHDFFDAIVSGEDAPRPKPAPDLYLECARRLALPPARCMAFEDAPAGAEAAAAAGMRLVVVPNPYVSKSHRWPTPHVFASLLEVLTAGILPE